MLYYEIYIKETGKRYFKRYSLRGSKRKFADFRVILSFYQKHGIIDKFYMFELSPEDEEGAKDV